MTDRDTLIIISATIAFCLAASYALYLIIFALAGMVWDTLQHRRKRRRVLLQIEQAEQALRLAQQDAVEEAELWLAVQSEAEEDV